MSAPPMIALQNALQRSRSSMWAASSLSASGVPCGRTPFVVTMTISSVPPRMFMTGEIVHSSMQLQRA